MIKVLDTSGSPSPARIASRDLAGRRHNESVLPRRRGLDGAKDHIVELYEPAKLGEVGADEGEVMPIVQLPDLSNPFQARPVAKLAAQCKAGVGWVGDQPVSPQQFDHSANRSRLRVVRVDVEVSGHKSGA
jgi:hypothetical protein